MNTIGNIDDFNSTPVGSELQTENDLLFGKEIIFVDTGIDNYQSLIDGAISEAEVVFLDSAADGVLQISNVLAQRTDITAVHIVSHGESGSLKLGSTSLDLDNIDEYSSDLQGWSNALSPDADLLFFGCNVAAGESGTEFVEKLSSITGADVAASDDLTGNSTLGGDWDLEVTVGTVETSLAFDSASLASFTETLALNISPDTTFSITGDSANDSLFIQVDSSNEIEYSEDGINFISSNFGVNSIDNFSIDLGDGFDSVTFQQGTGSWTGFDGDISVLAEDITFDTISNLSTTGDLLFTANDSDTNSATASISIIDSTISADDLILQATTEVNHASASSDLNLTNNASVDISGSNLTLNTLDISATTAGEVNSSSDTASIVDIIGGEDGSITNTIDESAIASINNATVAVSNTANISALSSSSYSANGFIAKNSLTGEVTASIENGTLTTTSGDVSISAQDDTSLTATSAPEEFVEIDGSSFDMSGTIASAQNSFNRATQAYIASNSDVNAGGNLDLEANRDVNLISDTDAISATASDGVGTIDLSLANSGTLAVNEVLGDVRAYVDSSEVTSGGNFVLNALDTSAIDARTESSSFSVSEDDLGIFNVTDGINGMDFAISTAIAFNTIGFAIIDFLTQTIDDLLGTDIWTESSLDVTASIEDTEVDAAGDVIIGGSTETVLNSTVSNTAESTSDTLFNSNSLSAASILSNNKVNGATKALIDNEDAVTPTVNADGNVTLTADDSTTIASNTKLVSTASTTNDGGISNLNDLMDDGLTADFTTENGSQSLSFGDRIRLADDYAVADFTTQPALGEDTNDQSISSGDFVEVSDGHAAGGNEGSIYKFLGSSTNIDLNDEDYSNTSRWAEVGGVAGGVYEYLGTNSTTDLGEVDYGDLDYWKRVNTTSYIPEGNNVTASDAIAVGGVVVTNEVENNVEASITAAEVTTINGDITLEGTQNATINAEADSAAEASGGSAYGTGTVIAAQGTVATNRILGSANAFITDSAINAGDTSGLLGNVDVTAQNTAAINAETFNSATSGDTAGAIVLAFNTIGWETSNLLFGNVAADTLNTILSTNIGSEQAAPAVQAYISDTIVTAVGDINLTADSNSTVNAHVNNEATSAAAALFGASGMSIGAVLASNAISSEAKAYIGDDPSAENSDLTQVNATGGIDILASDTTVVDATSTMNSIAATSNDGGASILDNFFTNLLSEYEYTTKSGTQTVKEFEVVRVASDYQSTKGTPGSLYQFIPDGVRDDDDQTYTESIDLSTEDFTDTSRWQLVSLETVDALLGNGFNVSDSDSTAIGGLITRNDVRSTTDSFINLATVTASGDINLSAIESANIQAASESVVSASGGSAYGTGDVIAVNGVITNNLILSEANVFITDSSVTATAGGITLDGLNTAQIDATTLTNLATGDTGAQAVLAFNTLGYDNQDIFSLALSGLLATPIGTETPAQVRAFIEDSTVDAGGDLGLSALNNALINATASNAAVSTASALYGATGMTVNGMLVTNKLSSNAEAYIADSNSSDGLVTDADADNVLITAEDNAGIYANSKIVSSTSTTNDGGASVLDDFIESVIPADFTTSDERKNLEFGDYVRLDEDYAVADFTSEADFAATTNFEDIQTGQYVEIAEGHAAGGEVGATYIYLGTDANLDLADIDYDGDSNWKQVGGTAGNIYKYMGTEQTRNLSTENYSDLDFWLEVPATDLIPQGNNISGSDAMTVGGLVAVNDVRAEVNAYIQDATVTAENGAIAITATESATIQALNDSIAEASGGDAFGGGDVLAANGVIASNFVLSEAQALVQDSAIDASGNISVDAQNTAIIDAETSATTSSGDGAFGVVLAFNTVGWEMNELSILALSDDAVMADLLGAPDTSSVFNLQQPASTQAFILDSNVSAGGDLSITADNIAQIDADVSNDSTSAASALVNASGKAAGLIFSSNKVVSSADAYIQETGTVNTVNAQGSITIAAEDAAGIDADISLLSESVTSNDGGLSIVENLIDTLIEDYQYTTNSGTQTVTEGDKVYIASDYAGGGDQQGVYIYTGSDDLTDEDLGNIDYSSNGDWELVNDSNVLTDAYDFLLGEDSPIRTNVTDSDSLAIGGVITFNDVRGNVNSYIDGAAVTATSGDMSITAKETATINANTDSVVTSDGGSITGGGYSIAVNGVIASNAVLTEANAFVLDSDLVIGQTLTVDSVNSSIIDATVTSDTEAKGGALGVVMALNSVGTDLFDLLVTPIASALDTDTNDDVDDSVLGSILSAFTESPATVNSYIENSNIDAGGSIILDASNEAAITATQSASSTSFNISLNSSTSFAAAANLALNFIETETNAYIDADAGTTKSVESDGEISVSADDTSAIAADVQSASFSLAAGTSTAISFTLGASITVNDIESDVLADIRGEDLEVMAANGVNVDASSDSSMDVTAIAAAVSITASTSTAGALSGAGALAFNDITSSVEATISQGALVDVTSGDVELSALDTSQITTDAGGFAIAASLGSTGLAGGLGISIADNEIQKRVTAAIQGANTTVTGATGVDLTADSTATIQALTLAGGIAAAAGANTGVAGSGSGAIAINSINNTIEGTIEDGANVIATTGDVDLSATDNSTIIADAGSVAASLSLGASAAASLSVGAGIADNSINSNVQAYIDNATVNAVDGNVNLTADSDNTIDSLALAIAGAFSIGGTVSGAFAGAGADATNIITGGTQAYIQNNSDVDAGGALNISAVDDSEITADVGSLAFSAAVSSTASLAISIGVTLAENTINNSVLTYIGQDSSAGTDDTTVDAASVTLDADSTSTVESFGIAIAASAAASLASGGLAGGGASALNSTNKIVEAFIRNGSDVKATSGDLSLTADNSSTITSLVGAGGFSAGLVGAAVGVSIATNEIEDQVRTYIGDASVTAVGDLALLATSNTWNEANSLAAAASIGLAAGAGAGSLATVTDNTLVESYITDTVATDNITEFPDVTAGNITILATHDINANYAETAGLAASFGGVAIAVGSSQATVNVGGGASAYISGADVDASGNLDINALVITPTVDSSTGQGVFANSVGIGASGSLYGVSVVENYAQVTIDPTIQSYIGGGADVDVSGSGNVSIGSESQLDAEADTTGISAAFSLVGVSANVTQAKVDINPDVYTTIRDASEVTTTTGNITLQSAHNYNAATDSDRSDYKASANAKAPVTLGTTGAGTGADADADFSADVDTSVDSTSALAAGGDIIIQSLSYNDAEAYADGLTIALGLGLGTSNADVTVNGSTLARMDGNITSGDDLTILALDSSNSDADATANGGALISGQGAVANASNTPDVTAGIGDGTNTINVLLSGTANITAVTLGNVDADTTSASGGLVSDGSSEASATWTPTVLAEISGASTTLEADDINVQAFNNYDESGTMQSSNEVRAEADAVSGGVISGSGATAQITTDSDVQAKIGSGVDITFNNDFNTIAKSRNNGGGNASGQAFGVAAQGSVEFLGGMASNTQAYVEDSTSTDPASINSTGSGSIQFLSESDNEFLDSANSDLGLADTVHTGAGGLIGSGGATARIELNNPVTEANIGNNTIIDADNATLNVNAENNATLGAKANGTAIGLGADSESKATAKVNNAQTNADIGDNVDIAVDQFTLLADDQYVDVRAEAEANIGAAAGDVDAKVEADANLTTQAVIGTGTTITAPTKITIQAEAEDVRTQAHSFSNAEALGASIDSNANADKNINTNVIVDDTSEVKTSELDVLAIAPDPDPNSGNDSSSFINTENVWLAEAEYTDDTVLGTLIDVAESACGVAEEVVGWGASLIGVDEPDFDCEIDNPEVDASDGGERNSNSSVTFNADITVLNNDINPEFEVDATGQVTRMENVTATNNGSNLSVGSTVDTSEAIEVNDITNSSVGVIRLESNRGNSSGFSDIVYDTAFDTVDLLNASTADLVVNLIDPLPNNSEADIQRLSNDGAAAGWAYDVSTKENSSDITIENSNAAGGDVTLQNEILNSLGNTTITSAGGNITGGDEAELYLYNAFLSAGGSIGTDEGDRFSVNLVNVEDGDRPAIQQASGDAGVYLDVSTISLNSELTGMNIGLYDLESSNGDVDVQVNDAEVYTLSNYNATDDSFDTEITLVNLDVDLGAANVAGDLIVTAGADDTVTTNVNIVDTLTVEGTTFLTVQDAIQASAGTELAGGGAILDADTIEALDTELDNLEATAANSDVTVTNAGALVVGKLSDMEGISASGDVNVTASELNLFENINAGGSLALTVADENQGDNDLYIYGAALTAEDDIILSVGNTLVQNSSSVITAGGQLAIEVDSGDQIDVLGGKVNLLGEVNATAASVTANNDSDLVLLRSVSTNVGWTVQGAAGFTDVLYGSVLDDVISSTDGDDVLDGQAGDDSISGNDGEDALRGDAGLDTLEGGAGNDSLNGGADDDLLIGGADDDTLAGGAGSDSLEGGTGNDTADYSTSSAAVTVDISTSSSTGIGGDAEGDTLTGLENITGSDFADSLTGSDEDNELNGNLGDDTIVAGAGNDLLIGDSGDDSLVGGLGNDTLIGGGDSDTLVGVDSTDIAPGQGEIDELYGQTGTGNVFVLGADGTIYYDDGNDAANAQEDYALIYGFADDGENTIRLASGFSYYLAEISDGGFAGLTGLYVETNGISGFGETDELIAVVTSAAPDLPLEILVTGTGDFDYTGDSSQLALASVEGATADPVYDNEVIGSTANDYLRGTAFNDSISGEEGNDRLLGYDGTDFLDGGSGNDRLYGQDGEDTLEGGSGNDLLYGGNDADLVKGGSGDDFIIGGSGDDTIIGVDESSSTAGRGEIDFLRGQSGANTFILGVNNQVYYDDGDNTSNGQTDFARIIDFDETEDSIQLASGNTYFSATAPSGIGTGSGYAGVFLDSNDNDIFDIEDELIAVLFGVDAPDVAEEITDSTLGYVFDDND